MSGPEAIAILAGGTVAGMVNVVVGSGTLVTFPVLLAFGYAPVTANIANTVGLVPGSTAGAVGYRRELRGQRRRALPLAAVSLAGGAAGAALLLTLPASAFRAIVPAFIVIALALIVAQPHLGNRLARRRRQRRGTPGPWTAVGVACSGVYGGYFGAAQGILLLAILALGLDDELQRINALKVVLVGFVNLVAGVVFIAGARVAWAPALLIAAGSTIGGTVGARVGRRLPAGWLRALIVAVGVAAIVRLLA